MLLRVSWYHAIMCHTCTETGEHPLRVEGSFYRLCASPVHTAVSKHWSLQLYVWIYCWLCLQVRGTEHPAASCARRLQRSPATSQHHRRLPQGPRHLHQTVCSLALALVLLSTSQTYFSSSLEIAAAGFFCRPGAISVAEPTVWKHWRSVCLLPNVSQLCLLKCQLILTIDLVIWWIYIVY